MSKLYSSGFLLYQYLIILLIFLLTIELFLRVWQKLDYMLGLEWIMNKISPKSQFSKANKKE